MQTSEILRQKYGSIEEQIYYERLNSRIHGGITVGTYIETVNGIPETERPITENQADIYIDFLLPRHKIFLRFNGEDFHSIKKPFFKLCVGIYLLLNILTGISNKNDKLREKVVKKFFQTPIIQQELKEQNYCLFKKLEEALKKNSNSLFRAWDQGLKECINGELTEQEIRRILLYKEGSPEDKKTPTEIRLNVSKNDLIEKNRLLRNAQEKLKNDFYTVEQKEEINRDITLLKEKIVSIEDKIAFYQKELDLLKAREKITVPPHVDM